MNNRIRELAEQAKLYDGWFCGNGNIEKFAELIVQECIDLISPYTIKGVEMIDVGTHLHPIYVIRENFGMEMK